LVIPASGGNVKKLSSALLVYTVIGLVFGVFYREFTKFHGFDRYTMLSVMHAHALLLGALFCLILLAADRLFTFSHHRRFTVWFTLYNIGLGGTLAAMLVRGVLQVLGSDMAGLNHIAGLFHTILGISLVWSVLMVKQLLLQERQQA
jgi:hypothetical protein